MDQSTKKVIGPKLDTADGVIQNPSHPANNSASPVTRQMVYDRTRELALHAGRAPEEATHADHAQAKRELTGESDWDRQEARIDSTPADSTKRIL